MNALLPLAIVLAALVAQPAYAQPAAPAPATRQYAPSREVRLLHLALDVTPDFRQRTIAGEVTIRFQPIAKPCPELRLDAVDLAVTNVTSTARILAWQLTATQVIVTFAEPLPPDQEASLTLRYRAQPTEGLYFRTREMGYAPQDEHVWSQGEATQTRHWFPCFDAPNEKFTSEVTCRVPEGMVVLSNGRKVSEEKSAGLVAVRWSQDKPHANYLVTLVAGHFQALQSRYQELPLAFWTTPSDAPQAASSFRDTPDMLAFFEREIGVPFPWAKYDQVCIRDFTHGGMENTSLTTLQADALYSPETENLRNTQGLVAHELAHQWFGDLVTCKDWSQVWLNEGFATYYEHLYDEHKNGRDQLLYRLWQAAQTITSQADTRSMVSRTYEKPIELFDWRAYGKGAWVLHMLRSQLSPDLYRRGVKTFLERHQFGSVTTDDLSQVLEELSGRSFDQFFDQWARRPGTPVLDVDYQWDERAKVAKLTVRQTQPVTDQAPLFHLPLAVRFKTKGAATDRAVTVQERSEDFSFPLPQAPEIVRLDPELAILAKVNFHPPAPLLDAQLADASDVVGRLRAIEQLQTRHDHDTVTKLKSILHQDGFWGVRQEASKALRAIHTDEALDALLDSLKQSDARVRRQVVSDLGGFYRDAAYAALLRVVADEKNPDIQAEALTALAAYAKPEVRDILLRFLRSSSFRQRLADIALRAMRTQDDPTFVAPLLETLPRREAEFPTRTFVAGLDAVAFLARAQTNRDDVREFLSRQTAHLKQSVQLAALTALGTLNDPRALPVLETFARAAADSPERKAADKAIESLRAGHPASAELGSLRKEVLDLQKTQRDLRQELDTLKKKLEAAPPGKATLRR